MENSFALKLKQLREKKNLSLQELAGEVGVAKQSIHKFENGVVSPSSETLLKLADVLNVPYSFFYENDEKFSIKFRNIKFREKHKIADPEFEKELKEEVSRYLSKFLEVSEIVDERQEFYNPVKDLKITGQKDVEKAAKLIRKKWKIGNAPITDVVETLESQGVFVVEVTRYEDFTGLSAMANDVLPVVVLNENCLTVERKRFTALHELGHIVLELSPDTPDTKIEWFCDSFAGAILLVDDVLYNELGKNRTIITLAELKRIKELYGISIQAIIMRAFNSNFINDDTYKNWWTSYKEWNGKEPSKDFGQYRSNEKATRFQKLLVKAVVEKRLSIGKAAELGDRKIDLFRREIEELKFTVN